MGERKRLKRMALCCEKIDQNDNAFPFACGLILLKSVHTAWPGDAAEPTSRARHLLSALELIVCRPNDAESRVQPPP
jgi:hypothetical protein